MKDLIHEILNDYLIIINREDGTTMKVILQDQLDKISSTIEKEINKAT